MLNRTVLEKGRGVIYESEGARILWAFAAFELELPSGTAVRHVPGGDFFPASRLQTEKHHVYELRVSQPNP